jgi:hypothetical protein
VSNFQILLYHLLVREISSVKVASLLSNLIIFPVEWIHSKQKTKGFSKLGKNMLLTVLILTSEIEYLLLIKRNNLARICLQ